MSTMHHDAAQDTTTLSATERVWLERQGRAARSLEARQRKSASKGARFAPSSRANARPRRPTASQPR